MIASVMTTRRAGRPIDFHIPTRLKSIGGDFLRNRFPNFLFEAIKGGRTYTGGHSLSTQPGGAWPMCSAECEWVLAARWAPRRLLDCPDYIGKSARARMTRACFAVPFLLAASAAAQTTGEISGRIVDAQTEGPGAGAVVAAAGPAPHGAGPRRA